jgi:8-oxo-dGTP pyrophosphatase MutT (NUDIX family)
MGELKLNHRSYLSSIESFSCMNYLVSERVGAFIIRKNAKSLYELLLFQDLNDENATLQIPGGGIESGESLEAALHREIYEESGLTNLTIVRKLGISERCWLDTKTTNRRHCFLLEASCATGDRWEHIVCGTGYDAGFRFSYFWHRPAIDFTLPDEWQIFMNPRNIPELYDSVSLKSCQPMA